MSRIKAEMQDNRIKRLVLALVVMLSIFAVVKCSFGVIAATGYSDVTVQHDGKIVKSVTVMQGHKETISAVRPSGIDVCDYQWQVRTSDRVWVDIYEQTGETLDVSDAVLESVLDEGGSAYVRCKVISGDLELASDACKVTISYNAEDADKASTIVYYDAADYGSNDDDGEDNDAGIATPTDAQDDVATLAAASDEEIMPVADTENIVTVTINYLDAVSQNKIYSSYIASMEKGSAFTQSVTFPTYIGYSPYYKPNDWDATDSYTTDAGGERVAIDPDVSSEWSSISKFTTRIESVDKNYVINIYYFASNVPWKANYYFQNIYDDNYTIRTSAMKNGMAKTGTIVDDETLTGDVEATGFTKLYHYPEAVAADGSTVFECYYDRNYYLINFDLNGGHGVDPIYARYETPYVVNEPTRYGYVFKGWLKGTENSDGTVTYSGNVLSSSDLPGTIQPENVIYQAQWEKTTANYTIVYWAQNADPDDDGTYGYSYWGSVTKSATSGDSVSGVEINTSEVDIPDDLTYFTYNDDKTDKDIVVKGDGSTIVNVYYDRNDYTLRFYYSKSTTTTTTTSTMTTTMIQGGSTYDMSKSTTAAASADNSSPENRVGKINLVTGNWGTSKSSIEFNDGVSGLYEFGSDVVNGVAYNYLQFKAKYNADISNLWPTAPFKPVQLSAKNNGYNFAYFSAWNIEKNAQYTIDCGGNYTVKGTYQRLDKELMYQSGIENTSKMVIFLAFWENGASNVNWAEPFEWVYCNYIPVIDNSEVDENLTIEYPENSGQKFNVYKQYTYSDGVTRWYKLYGNKLIVTCDNNTSDDSQSGNNTHMWIAQTPTALEGYSYVNTNASNPKLKPSNRNAYRNEDVTYTNGTVSDSRPSYTMEFYYERKTYDFNFQNYGVQTEVFTVPYGTVLGTYKQDDSEDIEYKDTGESTGKTFQEFFKSPTYPETLEQGAYEFEGWYTTPDHLDGTKVDESLWTTYTMPASNTTLYAKWVPVEHTVNCFITYDDMLAYEKEVAAALTEAATILERYVKEGKCLHTKSVSHGDVYGSIVNPSGYMDESGLELTFDGWFYMENGDKKAYTPLNMPVNRDMNVFADWGSHTPQPYTLHYVLYDAETNRDIIALLNTASLGEPEENETYKVTYKESSVSYLYVNGGYHRFVAADTNGYAYQGSTRTFTAKAGDPYNQLYSEYNVGYYPTVSTHSITVAYEENKLRAENNVYTFFYVYVESVDYMVKYINKDTGLNVFDGEVVEDKHGEASNAVVTERFKVIDGYLPDAFYKRLVLSVQEVDGKWVGSTDNVITFYYTENKNAAYYAVHFMLQDIDADGTTKDFNESGKYIGGDYSESDYMIEGIATVDETTKTGTVQISPYTFTGFSLATEDTTVSPCTAVSLEDDSSSAEGTKTVLTEYAYDSPNPGKYTVTVNNHGTDIYIFYDRQSYDYTVYYLLEGTAISSYTDLINYTDSKDAAVLEDACTYPAEKYGKTVTVEAIDIEGYTCSSATTQSLVIGAKTENDEQKGYTPNYVIFYYIAESYTVEYVAVPESGGSLSKHNVTFEGSYAKSDKANDETSLDSKATPEDGFQFAGWYLDEACTIPIDTKYTNEDGTEYVKATLLTDGVTIRPDPAYLNAAPSKNVFYAKFTRAYGSLTIRRSGSNDEGGGSQVFVYEIKNKETGEIITVTISGDGEKVIKDLPYGTYEIRQVDSWSWRYDDSNTEVTINAEGKEKTVEFKGTSDNDKWLSDNSVSIKNEMKSQSAADSTTEAATESK